MRVAIIGAGVAGLTSARHVTSEGIDCDVLEMTSELGGNWVYTDDIWKDKDGFAVHSSMYKNLKTNVPKQLIGFPDFPLHEQQESYMSQPDVLNFLNKFADHFNLHHLIKFNRMVIEIRPIDNRWQIKSLDKSTRQEVEDVYDSVMICSGIYHEPNIPTLFGQEKFSGRVLHSKEYRCNDPFRDQRVLIIGAGPSGFDCVFHMSTVAKYIVLSHHSDKTGNLETLPNVTMKPDVLCIKNEKEVEFIDGSCDFFDSIIYCTGYKYHFPFLHSSCGITIEDNHVEPLYKHMINIKNPTMCFIGIPSYICHFIMCDVQARFYSKYLSGSMLLPSPEVMKKETEEEMKARWAKNYSKKKAHFMERDQGSYFDDLTSTAKITPVAPVINKLWLECLEGVFNDFPNFRKNKYKIIDNENYIKI